MKNTVPLLAFLSIALFSHCGTTQQALSDTVKTRNGLVKGVEQSGVRSFKGIPFAAPPVGDLRWKAPQAPKNWEGVRQCTSFSASPMQPKPVPFSCWSEEFIAPPEPLSEDCLYLNVWTAAASNKAKQPVIVWIYGGGFVSGSAACAVYDGADMARQGVVFVSINYRVGVFGFLALPELSAESGNHVSGNYALLDQIAALQWVKENIAAFGGDPENVTIAGQSAGSFSVNALIASPLAKGLFQRAIAQSGGLLKSGRLKTLPDAEQSGKAVFTATKTSTLADLRKMPAADLQKAAETLPFGIFSPVLENYVLPADLLSHFRQGHQNDISLMTGWVTGDGSLFGSQALNAEKFRQQAQERYGDKAAAFLSAFPAATDEEAKASQQRVTLCSFAALPAHLLAEYNKKPVYVYQFDFVPTDKPNFPNFGAFHTSEVPFALHTLHLWNRPWQARDRAMEKTMSAYWVNFAKTGDPNGAGLPQWKAYDLKTNAVMELGEKTGSREGLMKKEIAFLDGAL